MQFEEFEIIQITSEVTGVYEVRLRPKKKKRAVQFKPGQFYHIKNPTFEKPNITRAYSVTSTPSTPDQLSFCIKVYGPWSEKFLKKKAGESVWLFGPMGAFTLKEGVTNAVFIAGGVGITPILSILQSLHETNHKLPITLLYANKTPNTILKRDYVENMFGGKEHWQLHSLVSDASEEKNWKGFKGHIDKEFITQNVAYTKNTTFYVCGSQRFTKNIIELLKSCDIDSTNIKQEIFAAAIT